jgi:hypothetical protein
MANLSNGSDRLEGIMKRTPIAGGEMVHFYPEVDTTTVIRTLNVDEHALAREIKDLLRGCEARVDLIQTVQIIERPGEKITTYRKKVSIAKDK